MLSRSRVPVLLLLLAGLASAGGGPAVTLVVVRGDSPLSRRIANEYVDLRAIPAHHVLVLDDVPEADVIPVETFVGKIRRPIEEHLERHGLADRIELIAFSSGFPYGVNFRARVEGGRPGQQVGGIASLTGATYLGRAVEAGEEFWDLTTNRWFRLDRGDAGGGDADAPREPTAEERRLFAEAQAYLQRRLAAKALEVNGRLVASWPDAPEPRLQRAMILTALDRKPEAVDALREAVDRGWSNAGVLNRPELRPLAGTPGLQEQRDRMAGGGAAAFLPAAAFARVPAARERYRPAVMLAWTGPFGNSLPEVLGYLRAAAASDGSAPDGTVYLCRNGNVRSTAREPFFAAVSERLAALGRPVALLEKGEDGQNGIVPIGKEDVIGAVVGTAGFDWGRSGSRLLPGAIAEHLTSFGAHFGTAGQTKLTEFLRYGAAGASGTVMEPLAIHHKFPNPMIHAFYAEGCSLAEAFFQSVYGPYQLLVVGDGLARPFARFAPPPGIANPAPVAGRWTFDDPWGDDAPVEYWLDGVFVGEGGTLALDTTGLDDGWHDLRVVRVEPDAIATRTAVRFPLTVDNHGLGARARVATEDGIEVAVRGARAVELLVAGRVVARAAGDTVRSSLADVGPGPVTVVPRAEFDGARAWRGEPVRVVVPALAAEPAEAADGPRAPGLEGVAVLADGSERPVVVTHVGDRFGGRGLREQLDALGEVASVVLRGVLETPDAGLYELVLDGGGTVGLRVGGRTLVDGEALGGARRFALELPAGPCAVELSWEPQGRSKLAWSLCGATVWGAPALRRPAEERLDEPRVEVDGDALVLAWDRTQSRVAAVRLFPPEGAKAFPRAWTVGSSTSSRSSRFRDVDELVAVAAMAPKPPKEADAVPLYLELRFDDVRVRRLRLVPEGDVPVPARVEVVRASR